VAGELGFHHYALLLTVGAVHGRVPPGSLGGRVSAEVKSAAAEGPMELFVVSHGQEHRHRNCPTSSYCLTGRTSSTVRTGSCYCACCVSRAPTTPTHF
jgi:hypothetical protein